MTNHNNIVQGIQRDMEVHAEYKPRKDMTEYTMYMRVDPGKIVWDDALVIAYKWETGLTVTGETVEEEGEF